MAMRQRAAMQPDADDPSYHAPFTDIEYRGLGSTPLLTPKELHRPDFERDSRRINHRPPNSRSISPTYSEGSDTDTLLHQVTRV